jgi:hypothetical protein
MLQATTIILNTTGTFAWRNESDWGSRGCIAANESITTCGTEEQRETLRAVAGGLSKHMNTVKEGHRVILEITLRLGKGCKNAHVWQLARRCIIPIGCPDLSAVGPHHVTSLPPEEMGLYLSNYVRELLGRT